MKTVAQSNPLDTLHELLNDSKVCPQEKVKRLLGLQGLNFGDLAECLGRNRHHIHQVLLGNRESEILKRDIAAFFSMAVTDIWPEIKGDS